MKLCLLHRNKGINLQIMLFTQLARNSVLPCLKKKSNQQLIVMQPSRIASHSPSRPTSPPCYTLCDDVALLTVPEEIKFLKGILE